MPASPAPEPKTRAGSAGSIAPDPPDRQPHRSPGLCKSPARPRWPPWWRPSPASPPAASCFFFFFRLSWCGGRRGGSGGSEANLLFDCRWCGEEGGEVGGSGGKWGEVGGSGGKWGEVGGSGGKWRGGDGRDGGDAGDGGLVVWGVESNAQGQPPIQKKLESQTKIISVAWKEHGATLNPGITCVCIHTHFYTHQEACTYIYIYTHTQRTPRDCPGVEVYCQCICVLYTGLRKCCFRVKVWVQYFCLRSRKSCSQGLRFGVYFCRVKVRGL